MLCFIIVRVSGCGITKEAVSRISVLEELLLLDKLYKQIPSSTTAFSENQIFWISGTWKSLLMFSNIHMNHLGWFPVWEDMETKAPSFKKVGRI